MSLFDGNISAETRAKIGKLLIRLEPIIDRRLQREEIERWLRCIKNEVSAEEFVEVMKFFDVV